MTTVRMALANLPYPQSADDALRRCLAAISEARERGATLLCFPEDYLPGYRCWPGRHAPPPAAAMLAQAHARIAQAAQQAQLAVVLGTERVQDGAHLLTALVALPDGTVGFQDKVQLDPSEDDSYVPGTSRQVFRVGPLCFGISICHEGFRYPETVRWAARHGAQLVLHPHFAEAAPGDFAPTSFADPRNSFHEKAILCRAAENTCYVATVNCASPGSPTTSAVARPDGSVLAYQPYGQPGLLVVDLELALATRALALRLRSLPS